MIDFLSLRTPTDVIRIQRCIQSLWIIFVTSLTLHGTILYSQDTTTTNSDLQITFLANEGFLIQNGNDSVLIDGFIKDAYYGYGALPEDTYKQLISKQAPFEHIQLALTTHVHLDHFQTETAVKFLNSSTKSIFVSTEQVAQKIRLAENRPGVQNQMMPIWPDEREIKSLKVNGIKLEAFRLPHSGRQHVQIQNLGFVIHVGGKTVLHVGDAGALTADFEHLKLAGKSIDVAILPFWMFRNQKLVREHIAAKKYIAAHIATAQTEQIKKKLESMNFDIHVFDKPLDNKRFQSGSTTHQTHY